MTVLGGPNVNPNHNPIPTTLSLSLSLTITVYLTRSQPVRTANYGQTIKDSNVPQVSRIWGRQHESLNPLIISSLISCYDTSRCQKYRFKFDLWKYSFTNRVVNIWNIC